MVKYVLDHEDNHIMIEQHVAVIKDLRYSILDSKNTSETTKHQKESYLTKRGTARLRNASGVRVGSISCG
jgi:hypothetical protein